MIERKHFHVLGKVQGVGFRYFVLQIARHLKLTGFVRNEMDGSVYCEAQGSVENLQILHQRLQQGNGISKVQRVLAGERPVVNRENDFRISH